MDPAALAHAAELLRRDRLGDARAAIGALVARSPGNPDALTLAALLARRQGNDAAALDAFARARSADPANPARVNNHALALKQAGRFDEAVAAFDAALRLRPGHAATLANLGSCLIAADRPGEALAPLEQAVRAEPARGESWNNLGVALARTGDADAAADAYRKALAARPDYDEARLNLADLHLAAGRDRDALGLAETVLRASPGHPRASVIAATLAERADDAARAIALYRDCLDRAGLHVVPGVNLARLLIAGGDPVQALALCERLIAAAPSVTTPLALAMAALDRMGDRAALARLTALDRLVRVIDLDHVAGFASVDAFNTALVAELEAHPSLRPDPEGLVTRGGRQSDDLARETTPASAALAAIAADRMEACRRDLPDFDHPWIRARPASGSLTLWGTILRPGGEVGAHIHAPNWLSGVYYPAFPDDDAGDRGWFAIGALPAALGGGGTLTTYRPRAGRMILFPSFLWHATLPFSGPSPRISLAFDLVPPGIGRPHRLPPK
jgi:Tfp pilus assembly protein PilF